MRNSIIFFGLASVLFSCSVEPKTAENEQLDEQSIVADFSVSEEDSINWISFEEYEIANKIAAKPILIDAYTDWCKWCKVMDESTFSDQQIASYINRNFYAVRFNAETPEILVFQGVEYGNKIVANRQYSALADYLLEGELTFPSISFLDSNGSPNTILRGYQSALDMEPMLVYLAEGYSEELTWSNFAKRYESQL